MARQLPPLNSLRAFEAAARHLSITAAAEELRVTPAAVSHQVRQFEDHIGLPVFQRSGRSLMLTDAGSAGLRDLREGFARLSAAIDAIDSLGEAGVLNTSVSPSFAAKWLLPRLQSFYDEHPSIDVHVAASSQPADFAHDRADMAIRYGSGLYPDCHVERLLVESVIPVCSPSLLEKRGALRQAADLGNFTLLHDNSPDSDPTCPTWESWLRTAGATHVDPARGPRFNQSSMVIEAALLGRGVALAKATLAGGDIRAGRLVAPLGAAIPLDFAYYLVMPRAKLNLPKVSFFRDWLRKQVDTAIPVNAHPNLKLVG